MVAQDPKGAPAAKAAEAKAEEAKAAKEAKDKVSNAEKASRIQKRKAAEAVAKAAADEQATEVERSEKLAARIEADNAKANKARKDKAPYVVAPGKCLYSGRGMISAGKVVRGGDFEGQSLDEMIEAKIIQKSQAKQ